MEQRERWGGHKKNAAIDEEDEFDAMFQEEMGKQEPAAAPALEEVKRDVAKQESVEGLEELTGAKTLEEISEEVPQDIKDKIIDLEVE